MVLFKVVSLGECFLTKGAVKYGFNCFVEITFHLVTKQQQSVFGYIWHFCLDGRIFWCDEIFWMNLIFVPPQLCSIQKCHRTLIARKRLEPSVGKIVAFQMTPSVKWFLTLVTRKWSCFLVCWHVVLKVTFLCECVLTFCTRKGSLFGMGILMNLQSVFSRKRLATLITRKRLFSWMNGQMAFQYLFVIKCLFTVITFQTSWKYLAG